MVIDSISIKVLGNNQSNIWPGCEGNFIPPNDGIYTRHMYQRTMNYFELQNE